MKKFMLATLLLLQMSVLAQDFKFGKVSEEELQEQFYPSDSTADAAYLYKYRRSYFDYNSIDGFRLITEIHERIKIYTKDGFEYATKLETYYVPEIGQKESIGNIKAYTFNLENNKIVKEKLSKDAIFKEKLDPIFSQLKLTMPKIKEGSVLEIKYKIYSPYAEYIGDVDFQSGIPIKKLYAAIEIPEYYEYKQIPKGYFFLPVKNESKNAVIGDLHFRMNVFKYKGENLPALKDDEPFVANVDKYKGGVKFELTATDFLTVGGTYKTYSTSWESVSKQIYKSTNFGTELDRKSYFKKDLEFLLVSAKTDYEKASLIYQYVKSNVKWNGNYGKFTSNGVRKAYNEKVGNVADINLMLTAMLRFAGLKANPVLVSARGNGIPVAPTLDGFNYVVSIVTFSDNTYALLDATEPYSLPNILPLRALNWNGRVVRENGTSSWVKLTSTKPALTENTVMLKFTDDLIADGLIRTKFDNLSALNFRKNYNHIKEENLISKYEETNTIEIEDFKITNQLDLGKPVFRSVKFDSEDLIEEINGKLYIEPMLFLTQHTNPFKLDVRKYPVDFDSPWKNINRISLDIPEGYQVEKLPEGLAIGLPDNLGVFKYQLVIMGNKVKIVSILEFNEGMIPTHQYHILKDFYGALVKKQSEKIVFTKI